MRKLTVFLFVLLLSSLSLNMCLYSLLDVPAPAPWVELIEIECPRCGWDICRCAEICDVCGRLVCQCPNNDLPRPY